MLTKKRRKWTKITFDVQIFTHEYGNYHDWELDLHTEMSNLNVM